MLPSFPQGHYLFLSLCCLCHSWSSSLIFDHRTTTARWISTTASIPNDIISSNDFPRLSGKSIIRFECISKLWNSIISNLNSTLSGDLGLAKAVLMSHDEPCEGIPRFYFIYCKLPRFDPEVSWERAALQYYDEI